MTDPAIPATSAQSGEVVVPRGVLRELRLADVACGRNADGCDQRWDRALADVLSYERAAAPRIESALASDVRAAMVREAFLDLIADAYEFDEQLDEGSYHYTLHFTDASFEPLIAALGIKQQARSLEVDGQYFPGLESPAETVERVIEESTAAIRARPAPGDGE